MPLELLKTLKIFVFKKQEFLETKMEKKQGFANIDKETRLTEKKGSWMS